MDSRRVLKTLKLQHEGLYNLVTSAKHTSFRSDDGNFLPRAIFEEKSGIIRFRFDGGIQLSASMVESFSKLREIIYQNALVVSLQLGQGYILDNHRYLHGRTSFSGSRELLRALVDIPSSTRNAKAILFDIDGTLCRSEELSIDAYYSCISDVVGKHVTHENTPVNLHGRTDLGLLNDILDYHKVDANSQVVEKFLQLHPQYLERSLSKGFLSVSCPGAKETLDWLVKEKAKRSSLYLGLLTGNSHSNALLKLRAAGIEVGIFDLEISSFGDSHQNRLSLFQDSLSKLQENFGSHICASDVVVVGDTPLDIECAKQSGCSVIAVATGNYTVEELALFQPDFVCNQLIEAKEFFP